MSTTIISPSCRQERRGSFFKLIDSFAVEIGTLKKEMGKKTEPAEGDPQMDTLLGLGEEVRGLFLQTSPCAGIRSGLAGARDSGYDSLRRRLTVLDRLVHTHAVWLQLGLSHQEATDILQSQPAGSFVVRKSTSLQRKVISLRMNKDSAVTVKDFPVKESQYTFSLMGSGLSFADLFRLVAFCCISRDVLPFTLKLPEVIASSKTSADLEEVAKLGAGFWDSQLCHRSKDSVFLSGIAAPSSQTPVSLATTPGRPRLRTRTPSELDCCQSNGALCFINPLFIKVHQPDGDDSTTSRPSGTAKENQREEPVSDSLETNNKDPQHHPQVSDQAGQSNPQSLDRNPKLQDHNSPTSCSIQKLSKPRSPPPRPPPPQIVSQISAPPIRQRSMPEKIAWINFPKGKGEERGSSLLSRLGSSLSISPSSSPPKRLSISSPISIPRPSLPMTLQSLSCSPRQAKASPSSSHEEAQCHLALEDQTIERAVIRARLSQRHRTRRRPSASALVLQRALRGHLRKMSGVFNSLLTPEKRAIRRVVELSRDKSSYFGCLVQDYLSYMSEGAGTQAWQGYASGLELLQTLRQFITQMKSYLRQSSELEPPIESLIPEDQIDQVLEKAMHKCLLKTLKPVVSMALKEFQVRSGEWLELKENLALAKARLPQEMGVADTLPPDPVAIEKIKHKFHTMIKLYSPEKKVSVLLRVCKLIYTIMEDNSGRLYGADDFLPMLTYVLAQCDMPQLNNEILYMMELLDPSLLHGEGGYYLTSAYGAMSLIQNFQEEQAARVLSSETRNTLHQWHRRRTTQRFAPSIDDFQNYLRVALQELDSGCTAKTLQVRPYASVDEVCRLCAQKFKVSDPQNYGLFLVMEGSSQQLATDTHPQKIKAELHSRSQATPFHFVFRRVAPSAAPLDLTPNLNNLTGTPDPLDNLRALSRDLSPPSPEPTLSSGLSPTLSLSLPTTNGNSISV
ncbi:Rab interactor 2 [Dissostichus eleginoides]|uniref:Rab interactor 2 n=1 Tax=Dissostichus eleginoides TaxID=100907 RepID=A0AAD9CUF1_DISEL|nr:Rab interactor 2 [Dissostichus eleginoides]